MKRFRLEFTLSNSLKVVFVAKTMQNALDITLRNTVVNGLVKYGRMSGEPLIWDYRIIRLNIQHNSKASRLGLLYKALEQ